MPLLDIPNREQLDGPARDALESVLANLIGYLYTEHDDEGSHGDVTADSVTLRDGGYVELGDGSRVELIGDDVVITSASGTIQLRTMSGSTRATFGADPQDGQTGIEQQFTGAVSVPVLRLHAQSSYDPSGNDTSALLDLPSVSAPNYSVYRITGAAANIEGIYTSGATPVQGQRGQVLVLINNTGGTLSLANMASVSDEKKIIGGPIEVGDDGAIVLVYDDTNEGWQVIAAHKVGPFTDYTPVLSSTGTPPTGYSSTGRYTTRNGRIEGIASVTLSGGFSAGTGVYTISLPDTVVTPANSVHVIGSAIIFDSSTSEYYGGTVRLITGSVVTIIPETSRAQADPTTPMTFAASDQIGIAFSVELG